MRTTLHRSTASELFGMPDDGSRYEPVRGELRKMSPSGSERGAIIINVSVLLAQYVRSHAVRGPDLAFTRHERIPQSGIPKKFWPGAPDPAAEVLSPRDAYSEVDEKVEDGPGAGTRAVRIVDPRGRTVSLCRSTTDVARPSEGDEPDGGEAAPGFPRKVAEIFV